MVLKTQSSTLVGALLFGALAFTSCKDANSPGYEYMPDMYRSPAVEAYVDYGQDPYYFDEELVEEQRLQTKGMASRKPVEGTIAMSMDGVAEYNFPYPYEDSNEGYEAAGAELTSPIPMTEETVAAGKAHYEVFCQHCHGKKGAGDGAVVTVAEYPAPGAYNSDVGTGLKNLPEGKIFHSLMYGKNQGMGSHASQLSRKERWEVVQYVKYLQNDEKMPGEESVEEEGAEESGTEQGEATQEGNETASVE